MNQYHIFGTCILFAQWDRFVRTFPKALPGKNHLVAVMDHFTRRIEVKDLLVLISRKLKIFSTKTSHANLASQRFLFQITTNNLILRNIEVFAKSWGLNKDSHMWDVLRKMG